MSNIVLTKNATLSVGGVPLATGLRVSARTREPARRGREFWPPAAFTFTAKLEGTGSVDVFRALAPDIVVPPPVKMRLPWGLLGPIDFLGRAHGRTLEQDPAGQRVSLSMLADEPALRRELGLAYQRCYTPTGQVSALERAEAAAPQVRELAAAIRRGRYRGTRKMRNAMRRLLRADIAARRKRTRETGAA